MTQQSRNPLAARDPGRRKVVGGLFGLGAAALAAPVLTACGGGAGADPKTVTLGSNGGDATPKKAYAAVTAAFVKDSGLKVKTNTVDHDTFQKSISTYLQGTPDDVFTWFAGYRMDYFAKKKLCSPLDDVWDKIGADFSDATKQLSRGEDGKYYFVPLYNYPWAVFYRKSLFKERGYQVPQKWSEFIALTKQMKKDGLSPIASGYGGGDAWSILGAFDYLNLRTNGYDFHMSLMRGKVSWTDKRALAILDHWRELVPYYQQGAAGRSWQDAGQSLLDKKSGMAVIGLFLGQQITDEKIRADIDFFPFPEIDATHGQDAVEAPTDGFMLSRRPKNESGAKKFLEFLGGAHTEELYMGVDPSNLAVNEKASTGSYNALQKKSADLIASAKHISQFADRDSDPGFISTVVLPGLTEWLSHPDDGSGTLKKIESQRSRFFTA
ncbi:ABC transporter substrate-binding protein [Streptomyces sp. NPDC059837]|jgi:multiple sugar transport system substrate-binding protein|uniref:ABC transporter substrate-binding protein n=1 Tax=unclassified Streptomyces TaxID=2593676 RepID=UPI00224F30F7|nr:MULTISPECIES: ABC transporter substrate-binding protein [unclassified Streptomyces]MCX4405302.1 ABC transporter substrate-binding protein [Streptomyces sp. NBC_01764]MCX5190148.1 ABC transporter substrate-binding protein [Streptomyces sp. NBC_00268]